NPDRFVRQSAARLLTKADADTFHDIADASVRLGWDAAITIAWAFSLRSAGTVPYSIELGRRILEGDHSLTHKRDAARLVQRALGDVGPQQGVDPVFDGYRGLGNVHEASAEVASLQAAIANLYP